MKTHSFVRASLATSDKIGQNAKVVGVFLMLLSVGQAIPVKDGLESKVETADGSSGLLIVLLAAAAVLLLLLLLGGGGGGAFLLWKRRRQHRRAPTPRTPAIEIEGPSDETEMVEMSPPRRWEAYPGAWNTATGSFKGGQALF
uniref:Transmembrane protein n=1 Tax=Globodera pallida TaxID=36090 RepID=A0A183CQF2_GLOPA